MADQREASTNANTNNSMTGESSGNKKRTRVQFSCTACRYRKYVFFHLQSIDSIQFCNILTYSPPDSNATALTPATAAHAAATQHRAHMSATARGVALRSREPPTRPISRTACSIWRT